MDIGVSQFFSALRKARWTILACVAVGTLLAIVVSLVMPLSYETTAVVRVQPLQPIGDKEAAEQPGRQERILNSIASLARGDEVVRLAVQTVGPAMYPASENPRLLDRFLNLRRDVAHALSRKPDALVNTQAQPKDDHVERALKTAQKSLVVFVEPKTDLVVVRFTHPNPKIAASFVNALLDAVQAKARDQRNRDEVADFLQVQQRAYDQAYQDRLSKLANFSATRSVYALDVQRKLLLEREGSMRGQIEETTVSVVEKEHQMLRLSQQIQGVFPVGKYPQVKELIDSISSSTTAAQTPPVRQPRSEELGGTGAPLLLVRVYQESMQGLFKAQADIAGLTARKQKLSEDIEKVREQLRNLAGQAATFEQLQAKVNQAREAAEQYSSYVIKEMLRAEAARRGITSLDVAQAAAIPHDPIFPNPILIIPFGLLAGLALGVALALLRGLSPSQAITLRPVGERSDRVPNVGLVPFDLLSQAVRYAPPHRSN